ncbi:MAG: hypothetical protein Q4D81_02205, partial [Eubacteriales bacterium]|nr:hypothetical protein [Eubacteriales bacterium]
MKRPAVIAAILVLLLFNMPVYAASGYSGADDEVEEKVLVSAYGYSDSVDADNTSADNTSPSYDGSAAADQSDAVVYMFVSPERLPVQNGYPAVPESAVVKESGRRATPISIDEQTEADVREPATFMFLVDQSSSMKESGLKNAVELMESIRKHYALPEEPNYFFRGSEDGDIDSLVDSDTAFDSLTWRDDTDFYKSIDESLEKLSRMMRADSGSGWVPGSIASLVLLTDRDPEEIRAAETRIADYPEIVVHTVCFGQEAGAENDILFSGSTGVQAVIPEAGALYGRGASSAGSGIADFIDSLILYRFTVDTGMDSFSVRLSSNAGITNILENVKFLDSAASEDGPLAGGIPVLGQEPASADDSTDDPT